MTSQASGRANDFWGRGERPLLIEPTLPLSSLTARPSAPLQYLSVHNMLYLTEMASDADNNNCHAMADKRRKACEEVIPASEGDAVSAVSSGGTEDVLEISDVIAITWRIACQHNHVNPDQCTRLRFVRRTFPFLFPSSHSKTDHEPKTYALSSRTL
jgi:hypothetical protein